MNKIIIIGNLTQDPQMRTVSTANGQVSVCDFSVAVNSRKQGEDAQFFRCTAWRGLADVIGKYAAKGKKVSVAGPVTLRQYTDKNGVQRASMEVTVEDFEFCEKKEERGEAYDDDLKYEPPKQETKTQEKQMGLTEVQDDDLPF